MKKLYEWYQNMFPKKWKGKNGVGFLIFMWIMIAIFESYWLLTGNRDLWAIIGMPIFFGLLTLIIAKWSLRLF